MQWFIGESKRLPGRGPRKNIFKAATRSLAWMTEDHISRRYVAKHINH